MVITEQQLFDYIACPAMYDVKHNKNIQIEEPVSVAKLLNKVAKYFYMNLLNGKVPTSNDLKKKWDSICVQNPVYVDAKRNLEGMGLIMKLLQWASAEEILVVDMDSQYRLMFQIADPLPVELVGTMGTILALPNNKYELLVTDFSSKMPDQTLIDMKLKYSLDSYAFLGVYNKRVDGVKIRNVKNAKDFLTFRSEDDFHRLKQTVANVAICIKNKLFYPRESVMCSTCNAKDYCKAWC
jgi:hypothetical protein